jgi:hypothetical protein
MSAVPLLLLLSCALLAIADLFKTTAASTTATSSTTASLPCIINALLASLATTHPALSPLISTRIIDPFHLALQLTTKTVSENGTPDLLLTRLQQDIDRSAKELETRAGLVSRYRVFDAGLDVALASAWSVHLFKLITGNVNNESQTHNFASVPADAPVSASFRAAYDELVGEAALFAHFLHSQKSSRRGKGYEYFFTNRTIIISNLNFLTRLCADFICDGDAEYHYLNGLVRDVSKVLSRLEVQLIESMRVAERTREGHGRRLGQRDPERLPTYSASMELFRARQVTPCPCTVGKLPLHSFGTGSVSIIKDHIQLVNEALLTQDYKYSAKLDDTPIKNHLIANVNGFPDFQSMTLHDLRIDAAHTLREPLQAPKEVTFQHVTTQHSLFFLKTRSHLHSLAVQAVLDRAAPYMSSWEALYMRILTTEYESRFTVDIEEAMHTPSHVGHNAIRTLSTMSKSACGFGVAARLYLRSLLAMHTDSHRYELFGHHHRLHFLFADPDTLTTPPSFKEYFTRLFLHTWLLFKEPSEQLFDKMTYRKLCLGMAWRQRDRLVRWETSDPTVDAAFLLFYPVVREREKTFDELLAECFKKCALSVV